MGRARRARRNVSAGLFFLFLIVFASAAIGANFALRPAGVSTARAASSISIVSSNKEIKFLKDSDGAWMDDSSVVGLYKENDDTKYLLPRAGENESSKIVLYFGADAFGAPANGASAIKVISVGGAMGYGAHSGDVRRGGVLYGGIDGGNVVAAQENWVVNEYANIKGHPTRIDANFAMSANLLKAIGDRLLKVSVCPYVATCRTGSSATHAPNIRILLRSKGRGAGAAWAQSQICAKTVTIKENIVGGFGNEVLWGEEAVLTPNEYSDGSGEDWPILQVTLDSFANSETYDFGLREIGIRLTVAPYDNVEIAMNEYGEISSDPSDRERGRATTCLTSGERRNVAAPATFAKPGDVLDVMLTLKRETWTLDLDDVLGRGAFSLELEECKDGSAYREFFLLPDDPIITWDENGRELLPTDEGMSGCGQRIRRVAQRVDKIALTPRIKCRATRSDRKPGTIEFRGAEDGKTTVSVVVDARAPNSPAADAENDYFARFLDDASGRRYFTSDEEAKKNGDAVEFLDIAGGSDKTAIRLTPDSMRWLAADEHGRENPNGGVRIGSDMIVYYRTRYCGDDLPLRDSDRLGRAFDGPLFKKEKVREGVYKYVELYDPSDASDSDKEVCEEALHRMAKVGVAAGDSPAALGLYEQNPMFEFVPTADSEPVARKIYYEPQDFAPARYAHATEGRNAFYYGFVPATPSGSPADAGLYEYDSNERAYKPATDLEPDGNKRYFERKKTYFEFELVPAPRAEDLSLYYALNADGEFVSAVGEFNPGTKYYREKRSENRAGEYVGVYATIAWAHDGEKGETRCEYRDRMWLDMRCLTEDSDGAYREGVRTDGVWSIEFMTYDSVGNRKCSTKKLFVRADIAEYRFVVRQSIGAPRAGDDELLGIDDYEFSVKTLSDGPSEYVKASETSISEGGVSRNFKTVSLRRDDRAAIKIELKGQKGSKLVLAHFASGSYEYDTTRFMRAGSYAYFLEECEEDGKKYSLTVDRHFCEMSKSGADPEISLTFKLKIKLSASGTSVTYDGRPKSAKIAALGAPAGESATAIAQSVKTRYRPAGETEYLTADPVDAGTYEFFAEIDHRRYYGNASGRLTVGRATPKVADPHAVQIAYGESLAKVGWLKERGDATIETEGGEATIENAMLANGGIRVVYEGISTFEVSSDGVPGHYEIVAPSEGEADYDMPRAGTLRIAIEFKPMKGKVVRPQSGLGYEVRFERDENGDLIPDPNYFATTAQVDVTVNHSKKVDIAVTDASKQKWRISRKRPDGTLEYYDFVKFGYTGASRNPVIGYAAKSMFEKDENGDFLDLKEHSRLEFAKLGPSARLSESEREIEGSGDFGALAFAEEPPTAAGLYAAKIEVDWRTCDYSLKKYVALRILPRRAELEIVGPSSHRFQCEEDPEVEAHCADDPQTAIGDLGLKFEYFYASGNPAFDRAFGALSAENAVRIEDMRDADMTRRPMRAGKYRVRVSPANENYSGEAVGEYEITQANEDCPEFLASWPSPRPSAYDSSFDLFFGQPLSEVALPEPSVPFEYRYREYRSPTIYDEKSVKLPGRAFCADERFDDWLERMNRGRTKDRFSDDAAGRKAYVAAMGEREPERSERFECYVCFAVDESFAARNDKKDPRKTYDPFDFAFAYERIALRVGDARADWSGTRPDPIAYGAPTSAFAEVGSFATLPSDWNAEKDGSKPSSKYSAIYGYELASGFAPGAEYFVATEFDAGTRHSERPRDWSSAPVPAGAQPSDMPSERYFEERYFPARRFEPGETYCAVSRYSPPFALTELPLDWVATGDATRYDPSDKYYVKTTGPERYSLAQRFDVRAEYCVAAEYESRGPFEARPDDWAQGANASDDSPSAKYFERVWLPARRFAKNSTYFQPIEFRRARPVGYRPSDWTMVAGATDSTRSMRYFERRLAPAPEFVTGMTYFAPVGHERVGSFAALPSDWNAEKDGSKPSSKYYEAEMRPAGEFVPGEEYYSIEGYEESSGSDGSYAPSGYALAAEFAPGRAYYVAKYEKCPPFGARPDDWASEPNTTDASPSDKYFARLERRALAPEYDANAPEYFVLAGYETRGPFDVRPDDWAASADPNSDLSSRYLICAPIPSAKFVKGERYVKISGYERRGRFAARPADWKADPGDAGSRYFLFAPELAERFKPGDYWFVSGYEPVGALADCPADWTLSGAEPDAPSARYCVRNGDGTHSFAQSFDPGTAYWLPKHSATRLDSRPDDWTSEPNRTDASPSDRYFVARYVRAPGFSPRADYFVPTFGDEKAYDARPADWASEPNPTDASPSDKYFAPRYVFAPGFVKGAEYSVAKFEKRVLSRFPADWDESGDPIEASASTKYWVFDRFKYVPATHFSRDADYYALAGYEKVEPFSRRPEDWSDFSAKYREAPLPGFPDGYFARTGEGTAESPYEYAPATGESPEVGETYYVFGYAQALPGDGKYSDPLPDFPIGYFAREGEGTDESPYEYAPAAGAPAEGGTYYVVSGYVPALPSQGAAYANPLPGFPDGYFAREGEGTEASPHIYAPAEGDPIDGRIYYVACEYAPALFDEGVAYASDAETPLPGFPAGYFMREGAGTSDEPFVYSPATGESPEVGEIYYVVSDYAQALPGDGVYSNPLPGFPDGYFMREGAGTEESPYEYAPVAGAPVEGETYYVVSGYVPALPSQGAAYANPLLGFPDGYYEVDANGAHIPATGAPAEGRIYYVVSGYVPALPSQGATYANPLPGFPSGYCVKVEENEEYVPATGEMPVEGVAYYKKIGEGEYALAIPEGDGKYTDPLPGFPIGYWARTGEGTADDPFVYSPAAGAPVEGETYCRSRAYALKESGPAREFRPGKEYCVVSGYESRGTFDSRPDDWTSEPNPTDDSCAEGYYDCRYVAPDSFEDGAELLHLIGYDAARGFDSRPDDWAIDGAADNFALSSKYYSGRNVPAPRFESGAEYFVPTGFARRGRFDSRPEDWTAARGARDASPSEAYYRLGAFGFAARFEPGTEYFLPVSFAKRVGRSDVMPSDWTSEPNPTNESPSDRYWVRNDDGTHELADRFEPGTTYWIPDDFAPTERLSELPTDWNAANDGDAPSAKYWFATFELAPRFEKGRPYFAPRGFRSHVFEQCPADWNARGDATRPSDRYCLGEYALAEGFCAGTTYYVAVFESESEAPTFEPAPAGLPADYFKRIGEGTAESPFAYAPATEFGDGEARYAFERRALPGDGRYVDAATTPLADFPRGYFVRSGEGTEASPYAYSAVSDPVVGAVYWTMGDDGHELAISLEKQTDGRYVDDMTTPLENFPHGYFLRSGEGTDASPHAYSAVFEPVAGETYRVFPRSREYRVREYSLAARFAPGREYFAPTGFKSVGRFERRPADWSGVDPSISAKRASTRYFEPTMRPATGDSAAYRPIFGNLRAFVEKPSDWTSEPNPTNESPSDKYFVRRFARAARFDKEATYYVANAIGALSVPRRLAVLRRNAPARDALGRTISIEADEYLKDGRVYRYVDPALYDICLTARFAPRGVGPARVAAKAQFWARGFASEYLASLDIEVVKRALEPVGPENAVETTYLAFDERDVSRDVELGFFDLAFSNEDFLRVYRESNATGADVVELCVSRDQFRLGAFNGERGGAFCLSGNAPGVPTLSAADISEYVESGCFDPTPFAAEVGQKFAFRDILTLSAGEREFDCVLMHPNYSGVARGIALRIGKSRLAPMTVPRLVREIEYRDSPEDVSLGSCSFVGEGGEIVRAEAGDAVPTLLTQSDGDAGWETVAKRDPSGEWQVFAAFGRAGLKARILYRYAPPGGNYEEFVGSEENGGRVETTIRKRDVSGRMRLSMNPGQRLAYKDVRYSTAEPFDPSGDECGNCFEYKFERGADMGADPDWHARIERAEGEAFALATRFEPGVRLYLPCGFEERAGLTETPSDWGGPGSGPSARYWVKNDDGTHSLAKRFEPGTTLYAPNEFELCGAFDERPDDWTSEPNPRGDSPSDRYCAETIASGPAPAGDYFLAVEILDPNYRGRKKLGFEIGRAKAYARAVFSETAREREDGGMQKEYSGGSQALDFELYEKRNGEICILREATETTYYSFGRPLSGGPTEIGLYDAATRLRSANYALCDEETDGEIAEWRARLVIGAKRADIDLANVRQTYGEPREVRVGLGTNAGAKCELRYGESRAARMPVEAGTHDVWLRFDASENNGYSEEINASEVGRGGGYRLVISKAPAKIALGGEGSEFEIAYSGRPGDCLMPYSTPYGLRIKCRRRPLGDPSVGAIECAPEDLGALDAGDYAIELFVDDANYAASRHVVLKVAKATVSVLSAPEFGEYEYSTDAPPEWVPGTGRCAFMNETVAGAFSVPVDPFETLGADGARRYPGARGLGAGAARVEYLFTPDSPNYWPAVGTAKIRIAKKRVGPEFFELSRLGETGLLRRGPHETPYDGAEKRLTCAFDAGLVRGYPRENGDFKVVTRYVRDGAYAMPIEPGEYRVRAQVIARNYRCESDEGLEFEHPLIICLGRPEIAEPPVALREFKLGDIADFAEDFAPGRATAGGTELRGAFSLAAEPVPFAKANVNSLRVRFEPDDARFEPVEFFVAARVIGDDPFTLDGAKKDTGMTASGANLSGKVVFPVFAPIGGSALAPSAGALAGAAVRIGDGGPIAFGTTIGELELRFVPADGTDLSAEAARLLSDCGTLAFDAPDDFVPSVGEPIPVKYALKQNACENRDLYTDLFCFVDARVAQAELKDSDFAFEFIRFSEGKGDALEITRRDTGEPFAAIVRETGREPFCLGAFRAALGPDPTPILSADGTRISLDSGNYRICAARCDAKECEFRSTADMSIAASKEWDGRPVDASSLCLTISNTQVPIDVSSARVELRDASGAVVDGSEIGKYLAFVSAKSDGAYAFGRFEFETLPPDISRLIRLNKPAELVDGIEIAHDAFDPEFSAHAQFNPTVEGAPECELSVKVAKFGSTAFRAPVPADMGAGMYAVRVEARATASGAFGAAEFAYRVDPAEIALVGETFGSGALKTTIGDGLDEFAINPAFEGGITVPHEIIYRGEDGVASNDRPTDAGTYDVEIRSTDPNLRITNGKGRLIVLPQPSMIEEAPLLASIDASGNNMTYLGRLTDATFLPGRGKAAIKTGTGAGTDITDQGRFELRLEPGASELPSGKSTVVVAFVPFNANIAVAEARIDIRVAQKGIPIELIFDVGKSAYDGTSRREAVGYRPPAFDPGIKLEFYALADAARRAVEPIGAGTYGIRAIFENAHCRPIVSAAASGGAPQFTVMRAERDLDALEDPIASKIAVGEPIGLTSLLSGRARYVGFPDDIPGEFSYVEKNRAFKKAGRYAVHYLFRPFDSANFAPYEREIEIDIRKGVATVVAFDPERDAASDWNSNEPFNALEYGTPADFESARFLAGFRTTPDRLTDALEFDLAHNGTTRAHGEILPAGTYFFKVRVCAADFESPWASFRYVVRKKRIDLDFVDVATGRAVTSYSSRYAEDPAVGVRLYAMSDDVAGKRRYLDKDADRIRDRVEYSYASAPGTPAYVGRSAPPARGRYELTATLVSDDYVASNTVSYGVERGTVKEISLDSDTLLRQVYGRVREPLVSTVPAGVEYYISYQGAGRTMPTAVGSYNITVNVSDPNFGFKQKNAVFRINPAPLSVVGLTVSDKPYDGVAALRVSGALKGVMPGDEVGLRLSARVADGVTSPGEHGVEITQCEISGLHASNYVLDYPEYRGKIRISGILAKDRGRTRSYATCADGFESGTEIEFKNVASSRNKTDIWSRMLGVRSSIVGYSITTNSVEGVFDGQCKISVEIPEYYASRDFDVKFAGALKDKPIQYTREGEFISFYASASSGEVVFESAEMRYGYVVVAILLAIVLIAVAFALILNPLRHRRHITDPAAPRAAIKRIKDESKRPAEASQAHNRSRRGQKDKR